MSYRRQKRGCNHVTPRFRSADFSAPPASIEFVAFQQFGCQGFIGATRGIIGGECYLRVTGWASFDAAQDRPFDAAQDARGVLVPFALSGVEGLGLGCLGALAHLGWPTRGPHPNLPPRGEGIIVLGPVAVRGLRVGVGLAGGAGPWEMAYPHPSTSLLFAGQALRHGSNPVRPELCRRGS